MIFAIGNTFDSNENVTVTFEVITYMVLKCSEFLTLEP